MKIVEINAVHSGSTGKIMFGIADELRKNGHEVWTFSAYYYQREKKAEFPVIEGHTYFGNCFENMIHLRSSQLTGFHGCFSYFGTRKLLKKIDCITPDVIHLHNLHNWMINIPMLFKYIKKKKIKVIWTLHDCWSMTGQCPYFSLIKCDKWKEGCHDCPQIHVYPQAFVDRTKTMWKLKKSWFTGIKDMTIVTPSKWLANIVKQSYLKNYTCKVINNGIDVSIFHEHNSDFRESIKVEEDNWKYLLLGVAFDWGKRKGLDIFIELANQLPKEYKIVLVGTSDEIDEILPKQIISIHRTNNQKELADIYAAGDVFINPTREDNYPTVNMEALACGTPVITFNTGGSPEIIDKSCGICVEQEDMDGLIQAIIQVCEQNKISRCACIKKGKMFDQKLRFAEYIRLIEQ